MPRTCRACASPERAAIDKALAIGEPFRNITKRFAISPAALFRHKKHVAGAIAKAEARREESIGDGIFKELRRVLDKGWELLNRAESEGDTRGAVVALREVRASLEAIDAMRSKDEVNQARIVVTYKRDPETPSVQIAERPALEVPGCVVQPEKPTLVLPAQAARGTFEDRANYVRAVRDVSRAVEPA